VSGNIGLIGLGLVGSAMAERLKANRFNVVGFDIDQAKCEQLEQLGAVTVDNPAQVAEQSDRIILSLPDTDAVLQVVEGPGGILEAKSLIKRPHWRNVSPGVMFLFWMLLFPVRAGKSEIKK